MEESGSAGERPGKGVGRSPLLVIFVTVFIDLLGFGIILPMLPFYAQQYGASDTAIGLLFASYSLMQFLFSPVWGRISDAVGRRPIILISLLGTAASFTVFGFAATLVLLFVGRILAGIFGGVITTAFAYIADVTRPEDRAKGMGLVGAAFGLGFIFGPFLGGIVADAWGLAAPAFVAGGLALGNTMLAWFTLPESLPAAKRSGSIDPAHRIRRTLSPARFIEALRHPAVGALLLLYFLGIVAFANMEATYALLTEQLFGWGARQNGYAFGFIGIVMVLMQGWLIRPLSDRFGEHRLVVAGTFLLIPGLGLLPFAPSFFPFILLSAVLAVGSGLINPSLNSLISRGVSETEQGGIMGVSQGLGSLGRVIGPIWGGFTFGNISRAAPYWTAAVMMFVCFVTAVVLQRRYGASTGRTRGTEPEDG